MSTIPSGSPPASGSLKTGMTAGLSDTSSGTRGEAPSRKPSMMRAASTRIRRTFGQRQPFTPPLPSALSYDTSSSASEILHKLNPIPRLRHATLRMTESPEAARVREKEAVINAGVIYGTRTYNWGTAPSSPRASGLGDAPLTANDLNASGGTIKRNRTIKRMFEVSKTLLRTKPLPSLPPLVSNTARLSSELTRQRTVIEISLDDDDENTSALDPSATFALERPISDADDDEEAAFGEGSNEVLEGLGISNVDRQNSRRRFSFDSSVAGTDSLFRNDSDASRTTKISLSAAVEGEDVVGSDVDVPPSDEDELDIEVPFAANVYTSDELANITAFDFADDLDGDEYDDLMLDEVNTGFDYDSDDSNNDNGPMRRPSLTPISERTDEEVTPISSPMMLDGSSPAYQSSPLAPRTHEVVAYVRRSRGWVVERRRRKGGWGNQGENESPDSPEVEEELVGTERVEKRAI